MSKAKKYKFYNIPKEYSLSDYKETVDYIIRRYSKINGLISIYNWGGKLTPGISDLDFIFVFGNKRFSSMPLSARGFYILNDKFRYIARHPFFYIDYESFKNIKYIYPDAKFQLLYGEDIKIKDIQSTEKYFSRVALLNDIIIRHYPRDFLEQSIIKSINARDMLLRLNSLKYSIRIIGILTKEKNSNYDYKLKQIERLRKNWFKEDDYNLLISLNEEAVNIGIEIAEKFREFLVSNKLVEIYSGNDAKYSGARNSTLFKSDWSREKAISEMSKLIINGQKFYSILPIEFVPQLIEYSKHKGAISQYIKNNLKHDVKYKLKYFDIVKRRIGILNKQAELASALKHSDFVAFFDFGYRNKSGINNLMLNLVRGYRD